MIARKGLLGKVILEQGSERNEKVSHGAVWKKSFLQHSFGDLNMPSLNEKMLWLR